MAGWTHFSGLGVALNLDNVDTDQIIPARFMSVPRKAGYGDYLFHDLRRLEDSQPDPEFVLNYVENARILVAGRNFGVGSSREAAVYALVDAGIKAVIAPSFGDIFANNAVNNGLLAAQVSFAAVKDMSEVLKTAATQIELDLEARKITLGDLMVSFDLDDTRRTKLINGWDDIDMTTQHVDQIAQFRQDRETNMPWSFPAT